jgi:hypothetical protein
MKLVLHIALCRVNVITGVLKQLFLEFVLILHNFKRFANSQYFLSLSILNIVKKCQLVRIFAFLNVVRLRSECQIILNLQIFFYCYESAPDRFIN